LVRATPPELFKLLVFGMGRAMRLQGSAALGRRLMLIGQRARPEDVQHVIHHIGTVDANTLRTMLISLQEHSARDVLSALSVPLLILSGDIDPFAPSERVGVPLHASVPGSELVRLPEGTHTALLEQPELIARAVEALAARCITPG
jgi:pimeloyl-ACP methyl ester carboxylesterase